MRSLLQSHLLKEVFPHPPPSIQRHAAEAGPRSTLSLLSCFISLPLTHHCLNFCHLLTCTLVSLSSPTSVNLLPWRLSGKEPACNAGDTGSVPGLGRSPGEGNGNPLQYACWEIPRATVHGVAKESELATKTTNRTTARKALEEQGSPLLTHLGPGLNNGCRRLGAHLPAGSLG